MAVTIDTPTNIQAGAITSLSGTVTPSGTPTGLLVSVLWETLASATLTAVTYDGASIIGNQIGSTQAHGGFFNQAVFQLASPPTGAKTLACTFSDVSYGILTGTPIFGGDTSTVVSDFDQTSGLSNTPSATVDSATGELVVDTLQTLTNVITEGGGQTSLWLITRNDFTGFSSSKAGASSVTMTESLGSSTGWVQTAVALKEGSSGITGTGAITLPQVTPAGSGTLTITGTGAATLPQVVPAGSGSVGSNLTGTGALNALKREKVSAYVVEKLYRVAV